MSIRGFSLLELLVTLLLASLLLALAIPSFSTQKQSTRVRAASLELLQSLHYTRTLAVSHSRRATIRHLGTWESGWEIFIDNNYNGQRDEHENLLQSFGPIAGVSITGNQPVSQYVSFISSGESRYVGTPNNGGFQAGTFTICPEQSDQGYRLILARSGRVRMEKAGSDSCVINTM